MLTFPTCLSCYNVVHVIHFYQEVRINVSNGTRSSVLLLNDLNKMKSKELKVLRKLLARANRCEDLLKGFDDEISINITNKVKNELSSEGKENRSRKNLSIIFLPADKVAEKRRNECLTLFENNMGEMYRNSSWGLDMEGKLEELKSKKARYLFAIDYDEKLAGFVHFRFELDDEESPTCAVLYIYEIQIASAYRRCGIGKRLMGVAERIAREQSMKKVVLTVFKNNHGAISFYQKALGYYVDESSPSKSGNLNVDYEILSLKFY